MNPIVRLIANALPGEKKYVLFAGAGISKDAGVPTAWDLMLKTAGILYVAENPEKEIINIDLEKWFLESEYAQMEYSELMELIYSKNPDQQDFLKKNLNKYNIGESHKGIAELARRGIIRAIITTNFDHYIERGLEERGLEFQVISTDDDLKNAEPLIQCKAVRIYKPHGNLGYGKLKNTPKDLESLSRLMEKELIRVMNEHGVIVLGYSGRDKGVQNIFKKRNYSYYPLFWVNPKPPDGIMEEILKRNDYIYIQCIGAGKFINEFIKLSDKISDIAPVIGTGPTIIDLENAIKENKTVSPIYLDYLNIIKKELEKIKPDFSKFAETDEAILWQINEGIQITYKYIEAALIASKYKNADASKTLYNYFGNLFKMCNVPEDFAGSYYEYEYDGYRFLIYEMFVSFVAALIEYDNWEIISAVLENDIFIEQRKSKYISFIKLNSFIFSLDETRNSRLHLNKISVMADLLKERFTNSDLSELISHRKFLEADYFIFIRSICNKQNIESQFTYRPSLWCPRSCIYLNWPPSYIVKAESKKFLEILIKALGVESSENFVKSLKENNSIFVKCFRNWIFSHNPLEDYNLSKIGTRK
ncbi:MAG: SIR2 family protein [Caldisericia bacterium]|nr:SIR2 family protein [Caldisericia bacterium]MDD5689463.1 SIR2 family protein [Caldisericia bacterium]